MFAAETHYSVRWLKIAGVLATMFPVVLIALIAGAELLRGDYSGYFELLPAIPLVVLCVLAWRNPHQGGQILVGVGFFLAFMYAYLMIGRGLSVVLYGISTLCLPAALGGVLFMVAAHPRANHHWRRSHPPAEL